MSKALGNPDGYIAIDDNGYYSLITKGETISDNYTFLSYAYDNYFIFKNENDLYGVLNIYSGVVIEPEYTFMLKISDRNAIEAKKDDGTIDIYSKKLEKISTIKDGIVENVSENYTIIYSNSEMIYINKDGEVVSNTEVYPNNQIFSFKAENGKWGYLDKSGNIVIEAKYDFATDTTKYNFSGILLDGKWGVVTDKGEVIVEPSYEIDTYYLPNFVGKYLLELTNTYHCLELK